MDSNEAVYPDLSALATGAERKSAVLAYHELTSKDYLDEARKMAVTFLLQCDNAGIISDHVRKDFVVVYGEQAWGTWAGSLFKNDLFEKTGRHVASPVPEYHANVRCEWRLKAEVYELLKKKEEIEKDYPS
jgi:hypothetical protein